MEDLVLQLLLVIFSFILENHQALGSINDACRGRCDDLPGYFCDTFISVCTSCDHCVPSHKNGCTKTCNDWALLKTTVASTKKNPTTATIITSTNTSLLNSSVATTLGNAVTNSGQSDLNETDEISGPAFQENGGFWIGLLVAASVFWVAVLLYFLCQHIKEKRKARNQEDGEEMELEEIQAHEEPAAPAAPNPPQPNSLEESRESNVLLHKKQKRVDPSPTVFRSRSMSGKGIKDDEASACPLVSYGHESGYNSAPNDFDIQEHSAPENDQYQGATPFNYHGQPAYRHDANRPSRLSPGSTIRQPVAPASMNHGGLIESNISHPGSLRTTDPGRGGNTEQRHQGEQAHGHPWGEVALPTTVQDGTHDRHEYALSTSPKLYPAVNIF